MLYRYRPYSLWSGETVVTSRRLIEGLLLFLLCFVFFTNSHCERGWGDATRGQATFRDGFLSGYGLRNHHSSGFRLSPQKPWSFRSAICGNWKHWTCESNRQICERHIDLYLWCEKLSSLKKIFEKFRLKAQVNPFPWWPAKAIRWQKVFIWEQPANYSVANQFFISSPCGEEVLPSN